jgi:protein O-GlcNAc transferase
VQSITVQRELEAGLEHHRAGRLTQAQSTYQAILERDPAQPDALHLLGVLACQLGDHARSIDFIQRAIHVAPTAAAFHLSLGDVHQCRGDFRAAEQAIRTALGINPHSAAALNNLGNAVHAQGRHDEAIRAYNAALAINPHEANFHFNLGIALKAIGGSTEAIAAFREAARLRPSFAEAHNNLGNLLRESGDTEAATASFRTAIQFRPDFPEASSNLATALMEQGNPAEATAILEAVARARPDALAYQRNLASCLHAQGRVDEAIEIFRKLTAAQPDWAEGFHCLGSALRHQGQLDEAIACFRTAIRLRPQAADYHSSLILTLHFHPDYDGAAILREATAWDERHAKPLRQYVHRSSGEDPNPARQLRIGYVSANLYEHPVARHLLLLLKSHDRQQFHISIYSNNSQSDPVTEQLRACVDQWRQITHVDDDRAADQIRADGIDILVDLSLHTTGNRLLVFARKPAPIQITFAGYPGTTGVSAIDYRITDPYLDPPDVSRPFYSEQPLQLPDSFWCYTAEDEPAVNELPADRAGHVTFACLNYNAKINEKMLNLWARVMRECANSRLMILADAGSHRQRILQILAHAGIVQNRVGFFERRRRPDYMRLYNELDISLDTFPYNGHTTSLDSLWMGVPIVSLVGEIAVSRGGLSILSNLGLRPLAADSESQFVEAAVSLAADLPRLAQLRRTLRQRIIESPLGHAHRFARNTEALYLAAWRRRLADVVEGAT